MLSRKTGWTDLTRPQTRQDNTRQFFFTDRTIKVIKTSRQDKRIFWERKDKPMLTSNSFHWSCGLSQKHTWCHLVRVCASPLKCHEIERIRQATCRAFIRKHVGWDKILKHLSVLTACHDREQMQGDKCHRQRKLVVINGTVTTFQDTDMVVICVSLTFCP